MPAPTKVLVVDDEPHVRRFVAMLVRSLLTGVEIFEAEDGKTALDQYAAHRPDLVMLDINLVGSSGLDVLRGIRAQDQRTAVVMLTAVDIRHAIEEALALGANGYILKESSAEEMADTLREVLESCNEGERGT